MRVNKIHGFTWADQDWIGLMILKNCADEDWIGSNFCGAGLDSNWKISVRSSLLEWELHQRAAHSWAIHSDRIMCALSTRTARRTRRKRYRSCAADVHVCIRDDRLVDFYYLILSCFWKMISALVKIIVSVSENYPKVHYDSQHTFFV